MIDTDDLQVDEQTIVSIHLSCDDFKGEFMEFCQETGEYIVTRMVPPGRLEYYFSLS
jgi:hypothetical protein